MLGASDACGVCEACLFKPGERCLLAAQKRKKKAPSELKASERKARREREAQLRAADDVDVYGVKRCGKCEGVDHAREACPLNLLDEPHTASPPDEHARWISSLDPEMQTVLAAVQQLAAAKASAPQPRARFSDAPGARERKNGEAAPGLAPPKLRELHKRLLAIAFCREDRPDAAEGDAG